MTKLSRQNIGGIDYTMVGCTLTGVCASGASDYVKAVVLSDGDILSDGMTVVVTFANGNTAGTAPASLTIYSSDQVNYYSDSGLTQPFTLAPSGCYEIEYTGTGNAYTYISYPVMQVGGVTAPLCDSCGKKTSGAVWDAGDAVLVLYSGNKFMIVSGLTNVVTADSKKAVTSGAVADAIGKVKDIMSSLPTDAVLHYSFDEVPDYPDGTADVRLIDNNTYDIQSTNYKFLNNGGATISDVNGNVQISIVGGSSTGVNINSTPIMNKIIKFKLNVSALTGSLNILNGLSTIVARIDKVGTYEICYLHSNTETTYKQLFILCNGTGNSCTFTVEKIYIGEGAYNTPIIDNSGNSNNATNNGGLAVQGVSGKGMCFLSANQYANINYNRHNSNNNLTISVWLNISTDYDSEGETAYKAIVATGAFAGCFGFYRQGNNIGFIARDNMYSREFTVAMDKGNWHLYTAVYNGNTRNYKFYLDGNLQGTSGANIENYSFGSSNWVIWGNAYRGGGTPVTTKQQGTIDDLLIFDRALTETEVMALYLNKANTPKYFPTPTNEIKQDSLELVTSGGAYSALHGANIASSVFTVTANWIANHTTDIRKLGNFLICNIFVQVMTAQTLSSAAKIAELSIKPQNNIRVLGAVESTGDVIKAEINPQGEVTVAPFSGSVSISGYIRFESIIFPVAAS